MTNVSALTVTSLVEPGDAGSFGTLTLASACPLSGVLKVEVSTNGACDRVHVQGNLDLASLALTVANTNSLSKDKRYMIASCSGTLSNTFLSAPLPLRWRVTYDTAAKSVYLSYNRGSLLCIQ
jgi:hypothetical protein